MTSAGPRPVPLSPRRRGPAEPSPMEFLRAKYAHPRYTIPVKPQDAYKHPMRAHRVQRAIDLHGEDWCGLPDEEVLP